MNEEQKWDRINRKKIRDISISASFNRAAEIMAACLSEKEVITEDEAIERIDSLARKIFAAEQKFSKEVEGKE